MRFASKRLVEELALPEAPGDFTARRSSLKQSLERITSHAPDNLSSQKECSKLMYDEAWKCLLASVTDDFDKARVRATSVEGVGA